ncbi:MULTISPECIES: hypothetical protein [Mycolicibacterium]|uniref:Uncharacterized protein n=2 Tax=Mycolicibacterium TaxID=1866885 RepID=A0A1E3RET9_MYCFV|nr:MULTISPECIES: hypothetical protein [Mycolicibacterium]MCV7280878.1 hypothetical protein [Mycolicibacterium flavescens]MDA4105346.1 hypothetical protein [Mycolicibacterium monacense DSM 44395]ODQ88373.1 hypothetical protein BHQ18_19740 [Mycolicibacterium flavescens]UBV14608.1 hypothetical protein H8Z57_28505 [Mycolicibacterium fortuitum]BBZ64022.1 hypothetical protein MMON_53230 [Mycolicibacterium monacense]
MININCAVASQCCAVRAQAAGITGLGYTLRTAVTGTRSAEHILKVASTDFSEIGDRCNSLTAVPHPPDNGLQVDEVAHALACRIPADVLSHLIESHTLPSINGSHSLQQHTNRGGIVYVCACIACALLVRPALRFSRTLARPQLVASAHGRKRRTGRELSSTTAATFARIADAFLDIQLHERRNAV